jgi:hypothetical protein
LFLFLFLLFFCPFFSVCGIPEALGFSNPHASEGFDSRVNVRTDGSIKENVPEGEDAFLIHPEIF